MRTPTTLAAGALLLAAGTLSPGPLDAQDITLRSHTRTELGGAMGRALSLFGSFREMARGQEEVTRISGTSLRTDHADGTSTIMEGAAARYIHLDHNERTYFSVSMEEMLAMSQELGERLAEARAEAEGARAEMEAAREEQADVNVSVRASLNRTGQRQTIAGYAAEQVHLEIFVDYAGTVEETDEEFSGSLVLFNDIWISQEAPGAEEMQRVYEAFGSHAAAEALAQNTAANLQQVFAMEPRIEEALERNREELEALDGTPLRTVSWFVIVPPGVEFDAAALPGQEDALGTDLRAEAAAAARGAAAEGAREAARGALRGISRGMLGRGGGTPDPEPEPEEVEFTQMVMMRIVDEFLGAERGTIPAEVFQIPEGYREVPLGGGAGG